MKVNCIVRGLILKQDDRIVDSVNSLFGCRIR